MKRSFVLFLSAVISLFVFQTSDAQSINIGIGGGLTNVQTPSYYTDSLGFSSEFHIGIKGKLNFPLVPITPIAFVEYHFLSGSQSTSAGSADTKQNILSIGIGGEYSLLPGPISPYLGVDFEFNSFGDREITGSPTAPGVSRSGLGLGAGVMIELLPVISLDASLKYQMLNLFGKIDNEDTIGIINLNVAVFF